MSKFVIECPHCGRYAEGRTGFFARKKIDCACGYTINVRTDKMASRQCPHCGNMVLFDQSQGESAKCPVCHEPINTMAEQNQMVDFSCAQCGARLLPLTPDARAAAGPARLLWYGDIKRASEGPHILQKDGWYYIILAEGGTGMTHQISVGRARTLDGPYEPCPYDPILRQYDPDGTLQKSGHGDLVETQNGQWYAVYLCARPQNGFSPLGRETALDPVEWTADGWPIINRRKGPSALQRRPDLPRFMPHAASLDPADARSLWVSPRQPADAVWDGHTLTLRGDTRDLDDKATKAGIYTRQTALQCSFSARLDTTLAPGQQAGITGYYDEKSYCKFGLRGIENGTLAELTVRSPEGETVVHTAPATCGTLRMEADGLTRRFYLNNTLFAELPRAEFLADEGRGCQKRFTGSMMGLYAVGADFTAKFGELTIENYMFDWTL